MAMLVITRGSHIASSTTMQLPARWTVIRWRRVIPQWSSPQMLGELGEELGPISSIYIFKMVI